jgi:glycosyltransferase involved in cell wall biosynthesis
MKKVAIIGTAGVPARYGGFETLAHQLVTNLNNEFELHVYCSNTYYKKEERVKYWNKARLFYVPLNANGMQSIFYDIVTIIHALFYADALIVLGVSGGIMIPFIKLFTNKKIIVNIDGLEWKRDKWNYFIRKYLKLSEFLAVKFSDADITDNAAIKKYTAFNYKTLSYLIEYGADHTQRVEIEEEDFIKYPFLGNSYAFKVCRIEPENNVHIVISAFAQMPEHKLVMVGNWNASEYGKQLKEKYQNTANILLLDPIYHQRTIDLLRSNCLMYVHGHSAGGTNPSLVEAMFLGNAVIAFNVSYNIATTENKAVYFKDEAELIALITQLTKEQIKANAVRMKEIADRRYTWREIASKYANLIYGFDYRYVKKSIHSSVKVVNENYLLKSGAAHLNNTKMFFE